MPGYTPNHLFPTMLDADPLSTVAERIRALATSLDGQPYTSATVAAPFSGVIRAVSSADVVTVFVDLTLAAPATWNTNTTLCTDLPAWARPRSNLPYGAMFARSSALPLFVRINVSGLVQVVSAGGTNPGGILGSVTYVR